MNTLIIGCALGLILLSKALLADSVSGEQIFQQPFKGEAGPRIPTDEQRTDTLNMTGTRIPLNRRTESMLREMGLSQRITAQLHSHKALNLITTNPIETVELRFSIDGISLCQYQVKSHETSDGKLLVLGRMPKIEVDRSYSLSDFPIESLVRNIIADTLSQNGITGPFTQLKAEPCLWAEDQIIYPAWVWEVESDGLIYSLIADDQRSFRFQPKFFHAVGKAQIYPNNVLDGEMQEFALRDMKETGYLENKYFSTVVGSPFDRALAQGLNFSFDPATQPSQFIETSLFTNANRALQWLESMGYQNFGTKPFRIVAHADFQGDINNALYQPGIEFDAILVGDGDGSILQNLATDADVVGHELGHHVIYSSVTDISGESLVLHEGLADFFNYARTGNACLGESICPATAFGAKICYVPQKCLRTAENNLKFTSVDLPKPAHLRSQFISGMLWDLYTKDQLPLNDVTHLVLKAIDFLVSDSGYKHFVVGLMLADYTAHQGKNCNVILNRALERGLGDFLTDISCKSVALAQNSTSVTDIVSPAKSTEPSSKTSPPPKKPGCGIVSGQQGTEDADWPIEVVYLMPLVVVAFRRLVS